MDYNCLSEMSGIFQVIHIGPKQKALIAVNQSREEIRVGTTKRKSLLLFTFDFLLQGTK